MSSIWIHITRSLSSQHWCSHLDPAPLNVLEKLVKPITLALQLTIIFTSSMVPSMTMQVVSQHPLTTLLGSIEHGHGRPQLHLALLTGHMLGDDNLGSHQQVQPTEHEETKHSPEPLTPPKEVINNKPNDPEIQGNHGNENMSRPFPLTGTFIGQWSSLWPKIQ